MPIQPPNKEDNEICCFAMVRVTEALLELERWRTDHEQSPIGAHAHTRDRLSREEHQVEALTTKLDVMATRQNQILAGLVGSLVLLIVNIVVFSVILEHM